MLKGVTTCAGMVLFLASCESPSPGFSPGPESYSESQVMIEGVADERTIASVDSTFFSLNQPMLGRDFVSQEYGSEAAVAILSYGFWVEHSGERPDVIGSHLEIGGEVRTVVGIMPQGVDVPEDVALWIPRELR